MINRTDVENATNLSHTFTDSTLSGDALMKVD